MRYMMLVRSVAPAGPPPSAFLEAIARLSARCSSYVLLGRFQA
jgi:hypothetical protein